MAKRNPLEEGQSFLEGILAKIPEDKRATAQEILTPLTEDFGNGVIRQDTFSRRMNEVSELEQSTKSYKDTLDSWYAKNVEAVEVGAKILSGEMKAVPASADPDDAGTPPLPTAVLKEFVKKSEVEKMIDAARTTAFQEVGSITTALQGLGYQFQRDFKEPPPSDFSSKIWQTAAQKQISLDAAYNELTQERREELNKAQLAADRKKMEEEVRAKIQEELNKSGRLPYPLSNAAEVATTLTALNKKGNTSPEYGVQAALDEYYRSQKP